MKSTIYGLLSTLCVLGSTSVALAQGTEGVDAGVPADITADKVLAEKKDRPQGFVPKLSVGLTGAYNHSSNVVGTNDGATVQIGLLLDGAANYYRGQSDWETELKVRESVSRTPQVPKFLKSADELELRSTYLYHLPSITWFGPYGRARLLAPLFDGYEVRAEDVTIIKPGRAPKLKPAGSSIPLTAPFEPLLLRESIGAFANPLNDKAFTAGAKVGFGAQHVFARDGFALADDAATPELEYRTLDTETQAGAELDVQLKGEWTAMVTWQAGAEYFLPVYSTLDGAPTGMDALNQEYSAKVSLKLSTWASLDYVLSAKRLPLIIDEWQVQNGLMFKAGYDLI